ncbi:MAG TPA: DNA polymerase III subunit chi [Steroidobacteraceae bacterium]|nr:DNA polymerase III subunit chi [Steroidobacteraceae bacterium]
MSEPPPDPIAPSERAQRVDFYVLAEQDERARLRLACRLAEKAYLAGQRVFVRVQDATELAGFDELLWSFADRSFVPHEAYLDARQWQDSAVLLGCRDAPDADYDVLLNLAEDAPAQPARAARIIEIVDADDARRLAGRARFRTYRDRGLNPQTHHIAAGQWP